MKKATVLIVLLVVFGGGAVALHNVLLRKETPVAADPAAATYIIDGQRANDLTLFSPFIAADINDDGLTDAVAMFVRTSAGSGTFYYVAAALREGDGYRGTNALLLGDRIAPQSINVRHGIIAANFADRAPTEPMTARPSVGTSLYAIFQDGLLREIPVKGKGEQLLFGQVTFGGNSRSFLPCGAADPLWLITESPAYDELMSGAEKHSGVARIPRVPVFAAVVGAITGAPTDAPTSAFKNGLRANQLVKFVPGGSCR